MSPPTGLEIWQISISVSRGADLDSLRPPLLRIEYRTPKSDRGRGSPDTEVIGQMLSRQAPWYTPGAAVRPAVLSVLRAEVRDGRRPATVETQVGASSA
jgi:hypothetical protein